MAIAWVMRSVNLNADGEPVSYGKWLDFQPEHGAYLLKQNPGRWEVANRHKEVPDNIRNMRRAKDGTMKPIDEAAVKAQKPGDKIGLGGK